MLAQVAALREWLHPMQEVLTRLAHCRDLLRDVEVC